MTGLEKIIAEIRDEATTEAAEATAKAKAQADKVLADAKAESDAKVARILAAADQDVADIAQSRESAIALQGRQRTLATKQQVLAETLAKAKESLHALPDGAYFDLLLKLAGKAAETGEGELFFNEKDKARAPQDFAAKLAGVLPAGSSLKVSDATRPIDGGFVLKYGDVEQNCSIGSMFDARADEFADLVRDTLFA